MLGSSTKSINELFSPWNILSAKSVMSCFALIFITNPALNSSIDMRIESGRVTDCREPFWTSTVPIKENASIVTSCPPRTDAWLGLISEKQGKN